jgi:hypothetical protein
MGEAGGGVIHWSMPICVIFFSVVVVFGVGIIVVNAVAEQFSSFAEGAFVIVDKQMVDVTRNYYFFEFKIGTVYLLYNLEGQSVSISEATYEYYSIGDFYPNTEPHRMIG